MALIRYIITATALLSISYLVFRLVYHNRKEFGQQRIFLLLILAFSLTLPLSGFRLDPSVFQPKTKINATENVRSYSGFNNETVLRGNQMEFSLNTSTVMAIFHPGPSGTHTISSAVGAFSFILLFVPACTNKKGLRFYGTLSL
jgi:hypothetical protein